MPGGGPAGKGHLRRPHQAADQSRGRPICHWRTRPAGRLRAAVQAGARWHGHMLQGPAHAPGQGRRPESPDQGTPRRPTSAQARFDREMKAAGRVEHPDIVRAMDAREIEGRPGLGHGICRRGGFGRPGRPPRPASHSRRLRNGSPGSSGVAVGTSKGWCTATSSPRI